jgi:hypothetical protein
MSVLSDMQSELAVDAHLETMGDTVVRVPNGGTSEEVVAVWNELPAVLDTETGERGVRHGDLQVPADQTVARGDKWTIAGEDWTIGRMENLGYFSGGFRIIRLERDEKMTTRKGSGHLI